MRVSPLVSTLVLAVAIMPAAAFHTTFAYRVSHLEVDGNVNGAGDADGTPDLVVPFDGTALSTTFTPLWGTVFESGGELHLQNPGHHYENDPVFPGLVFDQSTAWSTFQLHDGSGDVTISATWPFDGLPLDNYNCMLFQAFGGVFPEQQADACISNMSAEIAAMLPGGYLAGPARLSLAIQRLTSGGTGPVTLEMDPVGLDDFTGDTVYRLAFDDSTNEITSSVSIDGGASFHAFDPVGLQPFSYARIQLNVDPVTDPNATTTTTTTSSTTTSTIVIDGCTSVPRTCVGSVSRRGILQLGKRGLAAKDTAKAKVVPAAATIFGDPLTSTDYAICLYDGTTLRNAWFVPAAGECGASSCWRTAGGGYRYVDKAAGNAGVTKIVLKAGAAGKGRIDVKGKGSGLALAATALSSTVRLQVNGGPTCWEAVFSAASVNVGGSYKAKSD